MLENNKTEELVENVKKYINTNYELIKLEAIERLSVMISSVFSFLIIGLVLLLFIFFISLMAGFYLSDKCGNTYTGFGIVGLFYFLLAIVLIKTKKKSIEHPVRDRIIKEIFNNKG